MGNCAAIVKKASNKVEAGQGEEEEEEEEDGIDIKRDPNEL